MPNYTLNENGQVILETQMGVTMPVDYSFKVVNEFVHHPDRHYEELEALCLGMACHIDKLKADKKLNEIEFNYSQLPPPPPPKRYVSDGMTLKERLVFLPLAAMALYIPIFLWIKSL